jgi:hypothetical protein
MNVHIFVWETHDNQINVGHTYDDQKAKSVERKLLRNKRVDWYRHVTLLSVATSGCRGLEGSEILPQKMVI